MKTKDFRELQVSSSLLVVIFLCVLVLGVFIFLLGVSVGKKQVQISAATQVVAQQIQEPVKDQPAPKTAEQDQAKDKSPAGSASQTTPASGLSATQGTGSKIQAGGKTASPEPQKPASKGGTGTPTKTSAKAASGLFFIQIAAFTDRTQAAAEADKFKKRGYPVVVADPKPTDAKTWYRVRVGGYPTREKAAEILTELNEAAKKKTDFRIVKD